MKKQFLIFFFIGLFFDNVKCQTSSDNEVNKSFRIAFYNVENLFDTIDDPLKNDDEFLPDSKKGWSQDRYITKLNNLARVIDSIGSNECPEIVGLCEIENKKVLLDLVNTDILKDWNYQIVHEESPDERGIDVALLYRPDKFVYVSHQNIQIKFPFEENETTRDILYVKGVASQVDTLHLFVNHWSSRRNGAEKSEPKRIFIASELRKKVDEIFINNKKAKIIIMGDFNDNPTNKSIKETLKANNKKNKKINELYNLMYNKYVDEKTGTYFYQKSWDMLDQIIISKSLFEQKGLSTTPADGHIFKAEWLLYLDKKNNTQVPGKTYGGLNYYGGYSDHLPVYVDLKNFNF